MNTGPERLRVGLVAGSLAQGGAEKQLLYTVKALKEAGVEVRVYSLTRGEYTEPALQALGIQPIWFGQAASPILRAARLAKILRSYRPHLLQSATFFTNLYAALAAPWSGAIPIGCMRNDLAHSLKENPGWGPWLLRLPPYLLVNSHHARESAIGWGKAPGRVMVLPNVIDLIEFDRQATEAGQAPGSQETTVITVARLVPAKRLERFLEALHLARKQIPALRGLIAGDGPEKERLISKAGDLGLLPEGVVFLGRRQDVPALLARADLFLLTSEHEGFPNALIEAMAAGLPVVTTLAGDSGRIVEDGVSGYLVDGENSDQICERLVRLARSPELRRDLGRNGRQRVVTNFSFPELAPRLLEAYQDIAGQARSRRVLKLIAGLG